MPRVRPTGNQAALTLSQIGSSNLRYSSTIYLSPERVTSTIPDPREHVPTFNALAIRFLDDKSIIYSVNTRPQYSAFSSLHTTSSELPKFLPERVRGFERGSLSESSRGKRNLFRTIGHALTLTRKS